MNRTALSARSGHGSTERGARSRRGAAAALSLAVVLTACGASNTDQADANLNDPTEGPLAKLLGYDISPADQRAKELEVQQVLVECMKSEGWEYQPVDYSSGTGDFAAEFEEQMGDPEGYGEKFGYGVVRSYELQGGMSSQTFEDPNQEYMETLSQAEMEDYQAALYGEQSYSDVPDEEFVMPALEEQGCYGAAQLEVYGESPFNDPDMQERLNELFEDAESDPVITQAYEQWATCMADRDPSDEFTNPNEVVNGFYERLDTMQGIQTETSEDDGSGGVIVSSEAPLDGTDEIDEADLEELRQDELATWTDDWACQQDAELAKLRREVEQRLADDLLAEFPELGES